MLDQGQTFQIPGNTFSAPGMPEIIARVLRLAPWRRAAERCHPPALWRIRPGGYAKLLLVETRLLLTLIFRASSRPSS